MNRIMTFKVSEREPPLFSDLPSTPLFKLTPPPLLTFLKTVYRPICKGGCTHYASALSTFVRFYDNQFKSSLNIHTLQKGI